MGGGISQQQCGTLEQGTDHQLRREAREALRYLRGCTLYHEGQYAVRSGSEGTEQTAVLSAFGRETYTRG